MSDWWSNLSEKERLRRKGGSNSKPMPPFDTEGKSPKGRLFAMEAARRYSGHKPCTCSSCQEINRLKEQIK